MKPAVLLLTFLAIGVVSTGQTPPFDFEPQASGVSVRLRGVSAVSSEVAWASGAQGTVLRTTDAGRRWHKRVITGAEALDFRDIDAMSDDVAYALSIGPGDASRIYKTTDGGRRWTLQFRNGDPKAFFDAMAFSDATHGMAFSDSVGGQFVVLVTTDGATWARVPADRLPEALPGEGAFAASGTNVAVHGARHAWIGTTAGRVLRTTDGGRTWAVATTPIATGGATGIFSIAFRDERHGVVVGGNYQQERAAVDNAAVTDDGGVTWRLVKERGLSGYRSAVAGVPGRPGMLLAVGPSGADWSGDDGVSWSALPSAGFDALSLAPGGRVGWATGADGRIAKITRAR